MPLFGTTYFEIAHVIAGIDRSYGGPVEALLGLTAAQSGLGHCVSVITSSRRGDSLDTRLDFHKSGVTVRVASPSISKARWVPRLRSEIQEFIGAVDIVHFHGIWEFFLHDAARMATESEIPYIIRSCGMLHPDCLDRRSFSKRQVRWLRADRYIHQSGLLHFTSKRENDHVPPEFQAHPRVIVPNGVRLESVDGVVGGLDNLWDEHPKLKRKRRLLYLGRVHPIKNIELIIESLARLGREDIGFAIAGGGDVHYCEELDRLIASRGLTNQVTRLGPIYGRDKAALLRGAELFILASQHENFGVSVAEALACGVPVIVSDRVALAEEVSSAGAGRVTTLNIENIMSALRELLDDPLAYQTAAQGAQSLGRSAFDWKPIAAKWAEIYTSLIGSNKSRHR